MLRTYLSTLLLTVGLLSVGSMAQAQYYECRDLRGNVAIQQQPCQGMGIKQKQIDLKEKTPSTDTDSRNVADNASDGDVRGVLNQWLSRAGLLHTRAVYEQRFALMREQRPWWLSGILALAAFGWWYGFMLLVVAFRQSFWWGLAYLFVPLAAFIFIVLYWVRTWPYLALNIGFLLTAWALFLFVPLV